MAKYFSKSGKPKRPVKCYGSVYPPGGSMFPVKCPNKATPGDIYCHKCRVKPSEVKKYSRLWPGSR